MEVGAEGEAGEGGPEVEPAFGEGGGGEGIFGGEEGEDMREDGVR